MSPIYIVAEGDSLTAGYDSVANYPKYLIASYIDNRMVSFQNWGTPGETVVTMAGEAATQIDPEYDARKGKNVLCFWAGTNDMSGGSADGPTTYANYVSYCQARQAVGFTVIAFTVMNRGDAVQPTFTSGQPIFNADVRASWRTFASALVDVQAQPNLQDPTNTTYFQADKIHLTATGFAIVAALIKAQLDSVVG